MASIGAARPNNTASIRTPLFVLGVALALVAFLVMFAFGLLFANRAGGSATVPIVVAKQEIAQRTQIALDQVQVSYWPSAGVPAGALSRPSQLTGQFALVTILKGQPITTNVIGDVNALNNSQQVYLPIPTGYVALTLVTSEQQFVGGWPKQRDFVNIIATADTTKFTKANPRSVTVTAFTEVYIVATGVPAPVSTAGIAAGVPSSVTVEMTPCNAAYMTWLGANTDLKYELMSKDDYPKPPSAVDPACPVGTTVNPVGPSAVDARWHFLAA
jgi:Flp pilus assembly protein CpaB